MRSILYVLIAATLSLPPMIAAQTREPAVAQSAGQIGTTATLTPVESGDVFMARKMYREAIGQYRKAEQTPAMLNRIGVAYHYLNELDLAKKYYERALKAKPDFPDALNNLATVYYERRSYGKAIGLYHKAIHLDSNSATFYKGLGSAYWQSKKYKEAVQAYRQAIQLDPAVFGPAENGRVGTVLEDRNIGERAKLHYFLAKAFAESGNNDQALLYIRKSLEEGFQERKKYLEEPAFAKIREMKEFQDLMAAEPHAL
ncbi:MAG: tetratricopeptide repeat protein [Bryobacteraceae bacterium]|jgi:tetratricopeptide (TPR) repeat protein